MNYKPNAYLVRENSSIYSVKVTLPVYMHSLFGNRTVFMRSTGTSDLRQARIIRDKIMQEFFELRERVRPERKRNAVEQVLTELRSINQYVNQSKLTDFSNVRRCPTLVQLRDEFLMQYTDKRKLSTLSKYIKSVDVFTAHFRRKDFQLHEVNRTMVSEWLDEFKRDKASQTLANYIGCLSQLIEYAKNRYHDAPTDNVFKGHRLDVRHDRESYEPFSNAELAKVYNLLDVEMQNVTLIAMHSGMRLNEICSLTVDRIKTVEGILCFEINEGETRAAARLVPVHKSLKPLIKNSLRTTTAAFYFITPALQNVQTESSLHGIHNVLQELREKLWERQEQREKSFIVCGGCLLPSLIVQVQINSIKLNLAVASVIKRSIFPNTLIKRIKSWTLL